MTLQEKLNGQIEDCCSYTSSNRESWGRCSSLGGSDEESSADLRADDKLSQVFLSLAPHTHSLMEQIFNISVVSVKTQCSLSHIHPVI